MQTQDTFRINHNAGDSVRRGVRTPRSLVLRRNLYRSAPIPDEPTFKDLPDGTEFYSTKSRADAADRSFALRKVSASTFVHPADGSKPRSASPFMRVYLGD